MTALRTTDKWNVSQKALTAAQQGQKEKQVGWDLGAGIGKSLHYDSDETQKHQKFETHQGHTKVSDKDRQVFSKT